SLSTEKVSGNVMDATAASTTADQVSGDIVDTIEVFRVTKQVSGDVVDAIGVPSKAKQVSGHEFTRAVQDPLISGALAPENATAHGTVLGTPGYMAPEQERGEVNVIDQRTDVFALGSILND